MIDVLLSGGDLALSATHDLAVVGGQALSDQRIIRRLLCNPGDYIWHPTYGAGLGQLVGQPVNAQTIGALVRAQMYQEATVSHDPEPTITVGTVGETVILTINYVYLPTNSPGQLNIPLGSSVGT